MTQAEAKTKATSADVATFVAAVENDTRRTDAEKLLAIYAEATGMEPKMWGPSIIGYGSYVPRRFFAAQGQYLALSDGWLLQPRHTGRNGRAPRQARQAQNRRKLPLHQQARRCGRRHPQGNGEARPVLHGSNISAQLTDAIPRQGICHAPFDGVQRHAFVEFCEAATNRLQRSSPPTCQVQVMSCLPYPPRPIVVAVWYPPPTISSSDIGYRQKSIGRKPQISEIFSAPQRPRPAAPIAAAKSTLRVCR
jgi:hypothetical protein